MSIFQADLLSKALSCIPALFACAKRLKRRTEAFKKCYLFRTVTSAAQAVWEISPQECLSSSAPGVVPEQEARSGAKPSLRTLVPFKRHCAELRGTALKSGRPECLGKEGKKKKKKDGNSLATRATPSGCTEATENYLYRSTSVLGTLKDMSQNHTHSA